MSQELVPQQPSNQQPAAFQRNTSLSATANHGAIAIEQERAVAEAQGQLILAKKFPRDLTGANAELMESCSIRSFAEAAFYSVPNRGSGPSIRFAEEVARVYGNFQYGHRELSRGDGKSEIEVYAWDMEKNNYSKRQITVLHVVDTKNGPKVLRDQADIDNKIANVASKQIRGRILALMPKWLVAEAIDKCKATLAGTTTEPISVRVRKMTQAFAKYGVNATHLETYLGHTLDDTTIDELIDLTGVFNAVKDGAKPSDFFGAKEAEAEASASTANKLAEAAKAGASAPARTRKPAEQKQQAEATPPPAAQESKVTEKPSNTVEESEPAVTDGASAGDGESPSSPPEGDSDLF